MVPSEPIRDADGGDDVSSSSELTLEALNALARACQQAGLYGPEHPSARSAGKEAASLLAERVRARGALSVGVAPDRLYVDGEDVGGSSPLLVALADQLHSHDLARVTFQRELDEEQLCEFLGQASTTPREPDERLGRSPDLGSGWPGVRVETIQYERLTLGEGEEGWAAEVKEDHPAARLWLGLAGELWTPGADEEAEQAPDELLSVEALAAGLKQTARSERPPPAVARHLLRIAEEMAEGRSDAGWDGLKERFSRLMETAAGEDVQSVLGGGTDRRERTRFLLASAEWLPVGAVADLVEAADRAGDVDVSPWMLRLLGKMARHAEEARGQDREEADASFREAARRAITGWEVREDQPDQYGAALKEMSTAPPPGDFGERQLDVDPARVLKMCLELDEFGEPVERAYRSMVEEGREEEILELLAGSPADSEVAGKLWDELGTVESLRRLLERSPPDFEAVRRLVDRFGAVAAPPLIEILAESESRNVRRHVFDMLTDLGTDVAAEFVERLEADERWYVKRNMLALLAEMDELPESFKPRRYLRHDRPAVRYEAYKILVEGDQDRQEVLERLFDERQPRLVRLAFASLPTSVPASLVEAGLRHVADEELDDELRAVGIRALAESPTRGLRDLLLDLCQRRHPWLFWRRELVEPSSVLLAALEVLQENWPEHPEVEDVLQMARSSEAPEVRRAVARTGEETGE